MSAHSAAAVPDEPIPFTTVPPEPLPSAEAGRCCPDCGRPAPARDAIPTCDIHGPCWELVRNALVVNFAVVRNGQVLLGRRAFEPCPGHWEVRGGHVDKGEHPADAAAREAMEELGIRIDVGAIAGIYIASYSERHVTQSTVYLATTADEPRLASREVTDFGWFDPRRPPEPFVPQHRQRLADIAELITSRA